jgi:hypothetical protein
MSGRRAQGHLFTIFTKTDFQSPYTDNTFIIFKFFLLPYLKIEQHLEVRLSLCLNKRYAKKYIRVFN